MTSFAINAYQKLANTRSAWVWFEGTGALLEGQAVCYNWDYGTAADSDARRFNRVELPTTLNAQFFAGVAARPYAARSTGQLIEIYIPGSVCNVLSKASTTIGVGILTFDVTSSYQGYFRYSGVEGEGSLVPLQTVDRSTTAGLCLAKLQEGLPSGGVEVVPLVASSAIGTLMIGGTTLITGSTIAGNCTYTLANATKDGLRKKFGVITAEIVTSNFVITVTAGRTHELADAALATVTFTNAASLNTSVSLIWLGAWSVRGATITQPVFA